MQLSNYTYARNWLISLAFFNRYLHQKTQFDDYLTDRAISQFSQDPLPLQLR
jgi:hypothetical protein